MKNIFKILIFLPVASFLIISCTEGLKLEPVSQISVGSYWKTENDANGVLYGMYSRFRNTTANRFFWGELRSNDFGPSVGGEPIEHGPLYRNTLNASSPLPTWLTMYTVIHDANLILKYVPGITFASEDNKNSILAQAYAMRAYCYFVMVRTWGGVPLVVEPTEGYSEKSQRERATVEEVFTLIKKDIQDAITLFPNNNYPNGRFVWSKPAANALKADIYLWTGKRLGGGNADFTAALNALNDIETSDITLLPTFSRVFDYDNKGNKEILFAVRYMDQESGECGPYDQSFIHPQAMPGSNQLDDSTKIVLSGGRGYTYLQVQPHIRSSFSWMDQRRNASFKEIYTYVPIYPSGEKTYYTAIQVKFDGTFVSGQRYWYDDYIIYRYGDVLLMKAEAKNALGQDPTEDINKLRQRAYGDYFPQFAFVNGTKEENDAAILKEWMLEKIFEGRYWWDLLRFGKAFELVPSLQDKVGQNHLLLFPIVQATLSIEPKVVQNPGY
ncbi:MAG TPA: RagB/SusD family nutrient uptake outer membrane protein [Bacteroidales bacterium]|nr:RagB/SusD family nutrient uptake outer membrane protein [Bacteroidales bacterium]